MTGPSVLPFPDRRRPTSVPLAAPVVTPAVTAGPPRPATVGRAGTLVEEELARLPRGWFAVHAVSDGEAVLFDHVVIGPPGVFVLLTERHRGGHATVYQHTMYVDGHPQTVIASARTRAHLASTTLSAACDVPVDAQSVVVLVELDRVDVQRQPRRPVHVLERRALAEWLVQRPDRWDETTVAEVFGRVRDHLTWRA